MDSLIFAIYLLITHSMPLQYGVFIYQESESLEWVEPHQFAAVVIAEHAADGDFPTDSVSSAGATGLAQVMNSVRVGYNKNSGRKRVSKADLMDWRKNLRVAIWELDRVIRVHRTKPRCRGKDHHFHAHYLCDFDIRETCNTRWRQRLTRSVKRWEWHRDNVHRMGSHLSCVVTAKCDIGAGTSALAHSP